jgi:hypothetical protein
MQLLTFSKGYKSLLSRVQRSRTNEPDNREERKRLLKHTKIKKVGGRQNKKISQSKD